MEHYQEVMVDLSEYFMKKCVNAIPGGGLTMTSYPVGNKTSLSRKPFTADRKLLCFSIMKSWSFSIFYFKKPANINSKTYQFINVANGVSRSHKTATVFFFI